MIRTIGGMVLIGLMIALGAPGSLAAERPNVVLIMSDDQGYGDLGVHGNPVIQTPNIDRLAAESVEFRTFYVCPVCAPTRASLMTGRYNYRTRVTDTYIGRAADGPRRGDACRDALESRLSDRYLWEVAPRRQLPDAPDRPGV